jgi:acylphosphatase
MIQNYNITVKGKVQGVWFRKYTQEKAIALGLLGIVKNQSNGTVYIEVQGDEKMITLLIDWLKTKGSPLSNVTKVVYHTVNESKTYHNFKIVR